MSTPDPIVPPFPSVTTAVHQLCTAAAAYTDTATLAEAVHLATVRLDSVELRILVGELTARLAGCARQHGAEPTR